MLPRILLLLLLAVPGGPLLAQMPAPPARPAPAAPAPPAIAPAQAQSVLDMLRDDKRRAEFTATLEAITKATPAPAAAPAAVVAALPLVPDSLGAQVITQVSGAVANGGRQLVASVQAVNDLPLLWRWMSAQADDPAARALLAEASWRLLVVLGCALLAEWGLRRALRPVQRTVSRWAPPSPDSEVPRPTESGLASAEAGETELTEHRNRLVRAMGSLRRLPFLLGRLLLDLLPVAAFAIAANLLLGTALGQPEQTRLVILEVVQAYALARVVLAAAATLVSPAVPRLRLLHISDWAAAFLTRWIRRSVVLLLVGNAVVDVGGVLGMFHTAQDALLKLFALVLHVFLVVAVLQAREPVAARIHARRRAQGAWASLLNRLAESWHLLAIFGIVALWLVWALELRNGYVRLIQFSLVTFAILFAARLLGTVLLGGMERLRVAVAGGETQTGLAARAGVYVPVVRTAIIALLWCATGIALLTGWGLDPLTWFAYGGLGGRIVSAVLLIGLTVLIAVLVWEGANAGIERHLARLSDSAQLARAGRLRTLLPMLRTALMVTIVLVVALMALSEVGVNIAPLLAGAGVIGIAVGFGSQKLVQDLITGLFLLLENAMQVGDVVTLGGLSGTVEALSIRTIRLRALDGAVHLIPFSAVTTVTNQTRDYGFAVADVSVGLNEEPDPVADILRDIAAGMQADPDWGASILEPLDVMGVDKFVDLAWVMRVRLKTLPAARLKVARELNRRIKIRFDELAIESPFTSHRVLSTVPPPPAPKPAEQEQAA